MLMPSSLGNQPAMITVEEADDIAQFKDYSPEGPAAPAKEATAPAKQEAPAAAPAPASAPKTTPPAPTPKAVPTEAPAGTSDFGRSSLSSIHTGETDIALHRRKSVRKPTCSQDGS